MPVRKKTTGAKPTKREQLVARTASPDVMLNASRRVNAALGGSTNAHQFGGNLGDSIERRFDGGSDFLGGGPDLHQGAGGTQSTYPAQGYGNYYGAGQGFGPYNRFGPWMPGAGGGGFQYLRKFSGSSSFNHSVIASCVMAYLGYGVVRNIVDLYTNFATEGVRIHHPSASVRRFYEAWAKKIKLRDRTNRIFQDIFLTANVFVHRKWATLTNEQRRKLSRSEGEVQLIGDVLVVTNKKKREDIKPREEAMGSYLSVFKELPMSDAEAKEKSSARKSVKSKDIIKDLPTDPKNRIPWGYTSLNPLQMERRGSKFVDEGKWVMALDAQDTEALLKRYGGSYKDLGRSDKFPPELKGKMTKYAGEGAGYTSEVVFTDDDLSLVQDSNFDYWDWAVPFVFPALRALSFKDCLRNMEMRACQTVISSLFLMKLGDIEKGMAAEDEHFERLGDMLQMPGGAMYLIWNEAIDAQVLQADVSKLFDPKKHESADADILKSLGVPEVLLGGKGGNFSNSFISVAAILEKIKKVRGVVEDWLMGEIKLIADVMGHRQLPTIKWGKSNLVDKNAERTLLISLFDRGIASAELVLREFDTTFAVEAARQSEEKIVMDKTGVGVMDPRGPYLKPEQMIEQGIIKPGWEEEHGIKDFMKEKMKPKVTDPPGTKKPGGRPGGTPEGKRGKQDSPRGPKGQNVAELYEQIEELQAAGTEMLASLETRISTRFLKSQGLNFVKQATKYDRDRLEKVIHNVFSHMPTAPRNFDTDDFLVNIMRDENVTAKMKADVMATYYKKIAKYEEKFGKPPSREHRRQFIVSSWTQTAISHPRNGLIE